jgi:hypothetical protein
MVSGSIINCNSTSTKICFVTSKAVPRRAKRSVSTVGQSMTSLTFLHIRKVSIVKLRWAGHVARMGEGCAQGFGGEA